MRPTPPPPPLPVELWEVVATLLLGDGLNVVAISFLARLSRVLRPVVLAHIGRIKRLNTRQSEAWLRVVVLRQNLFLTGGAGVQSLAS